MNYSLGIDIGGTNIKIGLVNKDNYSIINKKVLKFDKNKEYTEIFSDIYKSSIDITNKAGIKYRDLSSVGVAVPGSIDYNIGTVIAAHNLRFYNVPIKKEFEKLFPYVKINIINDADGAAAAELKLGNLQDVKTGIFITIGTGFGGSLILNGTLFRGGLNHGVEPGHMTLNNKGEICTCGNPGCFDTLCSSEWLRKQGLKTLKTDKSSLILKKSHGNPENVNAEIIIKAVKEKDVAAISIFNEFLDNLSSALASITNFLDPEVIVIGGGISDAGNIFFDPLRKMVHKKNYFKHPYKILPAKCRNDSGIIGAAVID